MATPPPPPPPPHQPLNHGRGLASGFQSLRRLLHHPRQAVRVPTRPSLFIQLLDSLLGGVVAEPSTAPARSSHASNSTEAPPANQGTLLAICRALAGQALSVPKYGSLSNPKRGTQQKHTFGASQKCSRSAAVSVFTPKQDSARGDAPMHGLTDWMGCPLRFQVGVSR